MAEKILDRTQAAKASLKSQPPEEAPNTSKDALATPPTPPHQDSNMSRGQPAKVVKVPCVSADGTIPAAQLREFILEAIKDTQDEEVPSHSYVKPYSSA
ncbi:hypothetical protein LIER_42390 [Lithospermum erythrorhizon]|uniref:Uncharacterized protein n=1 Tax=Lithospermum erythrorhizon TaxID=34254 RepID=A0AAV3RNU9_LITER